MSRAVQHGRKAGKAAGDNPVVAVGLLCLLAFLAGYWWLAVLVIVVAVLATDIEDALLAWWDGRGPLTRCGVYASALVGAWLAVTFRVHLWHVVAFGVALAVGAMAAAGLWWRNRPWREHYRTYVEPLHWALGPAFGLKAAELEELRPTEWLAGVQPGLLDAQGAVLVRLPTARVLTELQKAEVERILVAKLGLRRSDVRATWREDGANRHLHVFRAPPPPQVPELVRFADVFDTVIATAKPSFLPLALGVNGKVLGADVASQTPHLVINARTGWGKSSAVGLAIAHVLHHGGDVVIPDIKVISLDQFEGLDGVTYRDDIAGIHDVLVRMGELLEFRNREVKRRKRAGLPRMEFPRALVVVEEINALMRRLKSHWLEVRPKGDRRPSPAITAYEDMLVMGRAVNVNLIAITQSGSVHAVGGRDAREQYGTRILGWYTKNTWNMLIPEHPYVMATDRAGHGWIARGKHVWEAQFIYAEDDELVAYATSGRRSAGALAQLTQGYAPSSSGAAHDPGSVGSDPAGQGLTLVPPIDAERPLGPISLRDASDDQGVSGGIVSLTLDQLHNDRKRHRSSFPKALFRASNGVDMYDRQDLIDWAESRPSGRRIQEA